LGSDNGDIIEAVDGDGSVFIATVKDPIFSPLLLM
jgi:hypothetical protein